MCDRYKLAGVVSTVVVAGVVASWSTVVSAPETDKRVKKPAVQKTDGEWRKQLTPQQYQVVRKKGTEAPFTGAYWNNHKVGSYQCIGCGKELFVSDSKYDSGCGWPSFYQPAKGAAITESADMSLGMVRTEVTCTNCGAHLGHVFDDGPKPTGLRYCINSASLKFAEKAKVASAEATRAVSQGKGLLASGKWTSAEESTTQLIRRISARQSASFNDASNRAIAMDILAQRRSKEAVAALIECLSDTRALNGSDNWVGMHAGNALKAITGEDLGYDQKAWRNWYKRRQAAAPSQ